MRLLNSYSDRQTKKLQGLVKKILALESEMEKLTDAQLKAKTEEFRQRYKSGEPLDSLLVESFAVCREADWRILGMKPYPVQVIGGIILHQGRIAEMKTGEGKTLVATLPAYLNGLTGEGVHIVTVNDYLAKRDSEQMGRVYRFLGLTVGLITHDVEPADRKKMYEADITYGTNNEFGFDYLRDNMAVNPDSVVQSNHTFAIVDEVDSILIDEARTPLIISGKGGVPSPMYQKADAFAKQLTAKKVKEFDRTLAEDDMSVDYLIDEKGKNVILTARGIQRAEQFFGVANLADTENCALNHFINQAVKANGVMLKDVNYIIKNGEIIIVDEFTGRLMYGRRYNDGLHQAIEAKEGVEIASESKTYATITFQNFFRLYRKLSGMTGTAQTEEGEFQHIYNLDVVAVPTNRPVIRKDHPDHVYATREEKVRAIIDQIQVCHKKGQPVLVGTVSVEKSEYLSSKLKELGISHSVLNAKYHEKEAEIVAQAGQFGSVTIATNMAGRGTDIVLGGNPEYLAMQELKQSGIDEAILMDATGYAETNNEMVLEVRAQYQNLCKKFKEQTTKNQKKVLEVGGLFIIGTERHESRRIDNQLRGRAGRQGDPGESRFFLSLEDSLLRLFIPEGTLRNLVGSGFESGEPLDSRFLSRAIGSAQKRLEGRNFDARKNVLQYDDVLNQQRQEIYEARNKILNGGDLSNVFHEMREWFIQFHVHAVCGDSNTLTTTMLQNLDFRIQNTLIPSTILSEEDIWMHTFLGKKQRKMQERLIAHLLQIAEEQHQKKEASLIGIDFRQVEKLFFLKTIDYFWMEHINNMTRFKDGIGLQGYGQNDPITVYKEWALEMYEEMIAKIRMSTILSVYRYQPVPVSAPNKTSEEGEIVNE